MIKAIIFDMNGVFIKDSGPVSHRIEKKFGISADVIWPLIKSALREVRKPGSSSKILWQPVLDRLGISYDDFFKFWFEGESINNDLLRFAKELKQSGIKIIILSNNFPERTNNYRERFSQLFELVDEQYFSWETGNVKPDLSAFTQILEKHDFLPNEYIYFDDNDDNLAAASILGIVAHKYQDLPDTKQFIKSIQNV